MKLLVTAKRLSLDKTSEAICTSKVIKALSESGHEILCLTSDPAFAGRADWFTLPWLGKARVLHIGHIGHSVKTEPNGWRAPASNLNKMLKAVAAVGTPGAVLSRKLDTLLAFATGYRSGVWQEVGEWRRAIQAIVRAEQPNALYIRAAGSEFEPHFAMLDWRCPRPWVAHYHDPFPSSLFPIPYQYDVPLLSRRQESLHHKIVRQADALTFPSQRLREWVLTGQLSTYQPKAFVSPHLAMDLPGDEQAENLPAALCPDSKHFNIVHTGTLLGPRKPWALIEGFLEFINGDAERKALARLFLIGRVHGNHLSDGRWKAATEHPNIKVSERISYGQSLTLLSAATVTVILEAEAQESPFFPAKLADYLWQGKPILALSPKHSVVADLLGNDYPLLVSPDDAAGVRQALESLWEAWRRGQLDSHAPASTCTDQLRDARVADELTQLFTTLANGQRSANTG